MGVDSSGNKDEGAGDQGIMFGYACKETKDLMPAPIHFSHKILRLIAEDRKKGVIKGIEPDSKSQVSMLYEDDKPTKVTSVVISTQHSKDLDQTQVKDVIIPDIKSCPSGNNWDVMAAVGPLGLSFMSPKSTVSHELIIVAANIKTAICFIVFFILFIF